MRKRKKPKRTAANVATSVSAAVQPSETKETEPRQSGDRPPSVMLRTWISIWLVFHLAALTISLTSVVEPSQIQSRLASLLRVYLQPTHFTIDGRPLYLTHGEPLEQPHRLQISRSSEVSIDEDAWTTIESPGIPGLASNDRYTRFLSTAAMLAENEQPGLVAELLLPLVQQGESIGAVRIIRLPTDLTTSLDDEAPPPYEARVIRTPTQASLVQLRPVRLNSIAAEEENEGE